MKNETTSDPRHDWIHLVGCTMEQAAEVAKSLHYRVRAVRINGEVLPTALDMNRTRINVRVENSLIVGIDGVY